MTTPTLACPRCGDTDDRTTCGLCKGAGRVGNAARWAGQIDTVIEVQSRHLGLLRFPVRVTTREQAYTGERLGSGSTSVAGDLEVFQQTGEGKWQGYWFARRESQGGGSQSAPHPEYDGAYRQLVTDVRFYVGFWDDYADCVQTGEVQGQQVLRVDGNHYVVGRGGGGGFGGQRFAFRLHDGTTVETADLWFQGRIPDEYRAVMPDNAVRA